MRGFHFASLWNSSTNNAILFSQVKFITQQLSLAYYSYSIVSLFLLGFSFGGLLACTVAACVWDLPYISSDLLKENLACITFGQPHVTLQIVQKVATQRPDLTSTIHTVYSQDDCVPQLVRLLDESWSSEALLQGAESSGIQLKVPENRKVVRENITVFLS